MQGFFYSSYLACTGVTSDKSTYVLTTISQMGKTVSGPSITAKKHLAQDSICALSPQEIVREDVSSLREIHRL